MFISLFERFTWFYPLAQKAHSDDASKQVIQVQEDGFEAWM